VRCCNTNVAMFILLMLEILVNKAVATVSVGYCAGFLNSVSPVILKTFQHLARSAASRDKTQTFSTLIIRLKVDRLADTKNCTSWRGLSPRFLHLLDSYVIFWFSLIINRQMTLWQTEVSFPCQAVLQILGHHMSVS